jgi:hypothetical protein
MFERIKEFWASMSTREKVALGILTAGVVGYALYVRHKSSQGTQAPGSTSNVDQFGNPLVGWDGSGPPPGTLPIQPVPPGTDPTPPAGTPPGSGTPKYVTVAQWTKTNPPWNSTFSGIANHEHETIDQLKALNPSITDINKLTVGQQVRIA